MTDEQARTDASAESTPPHESPGQLLRQGRERLNLSIEQVAERLRLRQQIVADLEQDQFSKYVNGTFTRGYLRAYARLVEVDDERVLAAYSSLGYTDKPQTMQSFSRRTRQQSHDNKLMLVTYVVGALIIGSAVVFWLQNNQTGDGDIATQSDRAGVGERLVEAQDTQVDVAAEESAVDAVNEVREPIFIDTSLLDRDAAEVPEVETDEAVGAIDTGTTGSDDEAASDASSSDGSVVAEEASESEQQAIADAQMQEQAEQSAAAETVNGDTAIPDAPLVLVFSGDAWIRIEDANGEALAFGVKPDGHISALEGEEPYQITLGAPENVTMYYQGEPVDLSSYRAGRVARFTIPNTE